MIEIVKILSILCGCLRGALSIDAAKEKSARHPEIVHHSGKHRRQHMFHAVEVPAIE